MGEPLKNRTLCKGYNCDDECSFRKSHVVSAIEWLKEQIQEGEAYEWYSSDDLPDALDSEEITKELMKLIDKAFHDVGK